MALKYVKTNRRRMNGRRKSRVPGSPWLWIILAVLILISTAIGIRLDQYAHDWEASHTSGEAK